ncbi:MAG: archaeosortase A [Halobacteria archaeon]
MEILAALIWVAIALFLLGLLFPDHARKLSAAGWIAFGSFWVTRLPYYMNETHSFVKTILIVAAFPASLYFAYQILFRKQDVLVKLSQAVAAMGLIYLPFAFYTPASNFLIEHTAAMEYHALNLLGIDANLVSRNGLENKFLIQNPETGKTYATYIILACTGIGSMAIFGGLIAVVKAPLDAKAKAFMVSIPVIYLLNLVRNVFITVAYGHQWFQIWGDTINDYFGEPQGYASFFWADKVISQTLSVVVLIAITFMVIKFMPRVLTLINELLDVLAGNSDGETKMEFGKKAD